MTAQDIQDILAKARAFNGANDITGMLLYRSGYFIQALEGDAERVRALYDKIAKDPRHRNVLMVYNKPIEKRTFGSWSMGFKDVADVDPSKFEGYTDFLEQPITPELIGDGSRARAFLEMFKEELSF
jgi:hypothetical protein